MSIQLVSLNVRGIRDPLKRRTIFNYYRKRGNILLLQETHSSEEDSELWTNEWGGEAIFSHGEKNSKGVAIFMEANLPYKICQVARDLEGRTIICELENKDDPTKRVTICNVYGPNKDNPNFYVNLMDLLKTMSSEYIIMGDFNLVMDVKVDRKGSERNLWKSRETLAEIMDEYMLVDIWRTRNEGVKLFSWMRTRPTLQASRLDYALITQGISTNVGLTMYLPGINSDHMAFYLSLDLSDTERGKGYWKFNNRLLKDVEYVKEINSLIARKLLEAEKLSRKEKWTFLKAELRRYTEKNCTQMYARNKASENDLVISQLSEKVLTMEYEISAEFDEQKHNLLCQTKAELEELLNEKVKGIMFRTKCMYYEHGERGSKYFHNMEKRRYAAKVCGKILKDDGSMITEPTQILKHQEQFYRELYTADKKVQFKIVNNSGIQVSEDIRDQQNIPFSMDEMARALKELKSDKTPGGDGWSPEFYKMFFKQLAKPMFDMFQHSFEEKELPGDLTSGIINLIPKSNKDSRILKFLRPITILGADYKVLEKMIANRLEAPLQEIINLDQKGFMKDRRIAANIRKIFDLMQYTKQQNMDAMILRF